MARSNSNIVALRVRCQRMAPTLQVGDILLVDRRQREIRNGMIYAIHEDNMTRPKRLVLLSDWLVRVVCDNLLYPPYEAPLNQLQIVGQVIWVERPLA